MDTPIDRWQQAASSNDRNATPYNEYLKTPEWKARRRRAIKRADRKCQLCGGRNTLFNVHHNTYDNLGAELDSDLIVLCVDCHEWYHRIREDQVEMLRDMNRRIDVLMLGRQSMKF